MRAAKRLLMLVVATTLLGSVSGLARADDFTIAPPGPIAATTQVNVTLVAIKENNSWDKQNPCNIGNVNDSHTVTASVTPAGDAVTSVNPTSLTFDTCGVAQSVTITVAAQGLCDKSGTVTIDATSVAPNGNAVKGVFNDAVLNVFVAGTNNADPSCGGGGSGSGTSVCALPAAPAWAAALLKASPMKPKSAKNEPNWVAEVAHQMGPGTTFNGVAKSLQGPDNGDAYATAVRDYLVGRGLTTLASVSDARLIRPGWECVPVV